MNEPKLRFKADDGNQFPSWDEKKLGDICTPLTYGMNVAAIKYDGLNKYIRITDIDDESHLYKSDEYVSPNGVLDDRYLVGENDILFARTGASVGKSYIYNKKDGKLYYAGFLIKAHVKSENSNFVFYQTLTERYAKWVQLTSMRSGQPGINANEYSEFGIQIPCLQEQQKIASLFTELDNLIQSAEKELEGYRELKQCMLQKMFPKKGETVPEIRFPEFSGYWKKHKLRDLAKIVGGGTPSTSNTDFWDGEINWFAPAEIASQVYVSSSKRKITKLGYNSSSARMLPIGTVLFTSRAGIGKTAILSEEACTNQGFQSIVPDGSKLDSYFIFARSAELKRYGETVGAGSTFVEVSGKQMAAMPLMIPPTLDEQKKIGEYFQNLDNLIASQQQELEGYKALKKGLLQQMFC